MLELLMTGVAAISIIGNIGVILKHRWGFAVWIVSGAVFIVYNYGLGSWSQVILWTVYVIIDIWGWMTWGKGEQR